MGYSTLNWVKHQIPNARINNFRVRDDGHSWLYKDGRNDYHRDCDQGMAEALFWRILSIQSKARNTKSNEKYHINKITKKKQTLCRSSSYDEWSVFSPTHIWK